MEKFSTGANWKIKSTDDVATIISKAKSRIAAKVTYLTSRRINVNIVLRDSSVTQFEKPWSNVYGSVVCINYYNRCHGNAVTGFSALLYVYDSMCYA
jgi:hypothetical protein